MIDRKTLMAWLEDHGLERHWVRAKPIRIVRRGVSHHMPNAEFVLAVTIHAGSGGVLRYGEEDHVEMPLFCSERQLFAWIREHGVAPEDVTADGITLHVPAESGPTVVEFTAVLRDQQGDQLIVDGDEVAMSRPAMPMRSLPPTSDREPALSGVQ